MSLIEERHAQIFPVLSPAQVEAARRFASGEARHFAPGETVFALGEPHAPLWLVLEGSIEVAHGGAPAAPTFRWPPSGQDNSLVKSANLAGRPSMGAGHAGRAGRGHRRSLRCAAPARPDDRLGGDRRDGDAGPYPAPRRPDRDRRDGNDPRRPGGRARACPAGGLPHPQRLSVHFARHLGPGRGKWTCRPAGTGPRGSSGRALPRRPGAAPADDGAGRRLPRPHARARPRQAA